MTKKSLTHLMEAVMQTKSYRNSVGSSLIACLVLGSVTASAADTPKVDAKADAVATTKEIVTRQENTQDAIAAFNNGTSLLTTGKYEDAIAQYLKALMILEKLPTTQSEDSVALRENCRKQIAYAYHYWAEDLYKLAQADAQAKKYDEAIQKCREAAKMYEPCSDLMNKEIAKYENMKRALEFRSSVAVETVLPDYEDNQNEIQIALQKARAFYKIGRWSEVIEQCKFVYTLDPYNVSAIDLERRATLKLIEAGKRRKDLTAEVAMNEANWSLVAPVLLSAVDAENEESATTPTLKQDPTKSLRAKLNSIKFTKLVFDQTPLDEVIQFLRERSKELDPSHEGVNFVLRFNEASANAEEGENSEDAEEDEESEEETEEGGFPSVTFYLGSEEDDDEEDEEGGEEAPQDAITLEKVIEAICQSASLHYRVEEYAVVIAPENVPLDDNVTLFFTVDKEAIDSMANSIAEGEDVTEDGEERSPLEIYLQRRGIQFNKGAKAVFDERINKLIVTNTPDMLDKISEVVNGLASNDPQVQIQVKFMEISQKDLEELGFEYFVSRSNTYDPNQLGDLTQIIFKPNPVDLSVPLEGQKVPFYRDTYLYSSSILPNEGGGNGYSYVSAPKAPVPVGKVPAGSEVVFEDMVMTKWYYADAPGDRSTGPSRHSMTYDANSKGLVRNANLNPVAFGGDDKTTVNDTVFNWSRMTSSGHKYEANLHALDQADSADTLTCPRVTTMAGEEATLKMVTTKIYPTEWEEASLDDADGTSVFTPSTPDVQRDSEGQVDEGIALTVTPQIIDEEKYTLDMEMNPMILDFAGWVDYSYQIVLDGQEWPNTLKMPIIEVRSVETKVVCYDRATVVLGGIVKDKVSIVDDQYPILGDLPVIGRLFQSKGKGSSKTNLLIFLTATLVRSDGSLLRPEGAGAGLPTF